jgi:hypothetical protein
MTALAIIFAAVSLLHLFRLIYSLPVLIGNYSLPMWFSVCGFIGAGILAILNWKCR